jgi:quercetin dioxygenase-like cupin family protein
VGKSIARRVLGAAAWIGSVALALGIGTAIGESVPPKENKGVRIGEPVILDLAPWADDMRGRQLRIRRFDIEPGGVTGIHSHDDRPDVSYLVRGTLTEFRPDSSSQSRASETLHAAGKGVTHWVANRGSTPAVLIVADIFKPQ